MEYNILWTIKMNAIILPNSTSVRVIKNKYICMYVCMYAVWIVTIHQCSDKISEHTKLGLILKNLV